MSHLRPGTVDYSKWDSLHVSDSDDEPNDTNNDGRVHEIQGEERSSSSDEGLLSDEYDSEYDSNYDDESSMDLDGGAPVNGQPPAHSPSPSVSSSLRTPVASLATLQKAWNINSKGEDSVRTAPTAGQAGSTNKGHFCAACSRPEAPFRCSRCQMVWFCNVSCQKAYHPVHRKECIDAKQHFQYWGFLSDNLPQQDGVASTTKLTPEQRRTALQNALQARINIRRRRALKQAAAAAAVERARTAREARGHGKGGGKGGGGKGTPDEKEETCSVCQCEFTVAGDGGAGLCCPSSHFMCNECAGVYVSSVLGDLHASYPPKCPMCRAFMPIDHFEAQLTSTQQVAVRAHAAEMALKPGQVLAKCAQCGHFDVENEPGSVVWWCDSCGYGTCFVCNKDLPRNVVKYDLDKSPHAVCRSLRFVKAKVETAIERGSQMECPGCGLGGRKDDACTHMTCPKCTTEWCYVCGLSVADCDKAPPRAGRPRNDIYLHNRDWEINEKRCPMYLTQILEVDLSWLGEDWENRATDDDFEDDEKCLDHFHRFRTIKKLQDVMNEVGSRDFQAVFENFDSIKNAGYSLEEVVSTSTDQLIDREEYIRQTEEADSRDEDSVEEGSDGDDESMDEEQQFEEVPDAMTRAVLQEEEQMRQAIEASRRDEQATGSVDGNSQNEGDDNSMEYEFEQVPEEMTRAVLQEEGALRHAIEASRASAREDELVRTVLANTMPSH